MTTAMNATVAECGHEGHCGGRLRQARADGRLFCCQRAGHDTPHPGRGRCALHGGSTPSHVAAAERQAQQDALAKARETFGIALDVEPGEALLQLVRTSSGVCAWLSARIEGLTGVTMGDKAHPLVGLFLDERKHLAQVSKAALDAGIAERRVRLEEEQGRLLVGLLERVIRRLDELVFAQTGRRLLDPMDPKIRELVHLELVAIDATVVEEASA